MSRSYEVAASESALDRQAWLTAYLMTQLTHSLGAYEATMDELQNLREADDVPERYRALAGSSHNLNEHLFTELDSTTKPSKLDPVAPNVEREEDDLPLFYSLGISALDAFSEQETDLPLSRLGRLIASEHEFGRRLTEAQMNERRRGRAEPKGDRYWRRIHDARLAFSFGDRKPTNSRRRASRTNERAEGVLGHTLEGPFALGRAPLDAYLVSAHVEAECVQTRVQARSPSI